ncbi:MAG: alpha/beta hydrolase [Saprospiraceae bacterium]
MKYILILASALVIAGFLGPKVTFDHPKLLKTPIEVSLAALDNYIQKQEATISDLKPDNQARIIWANDSTKQKTEYSLVYLHGFSASQEEGDPMHQEFAARYGMNLYLSRLEDHGRLDSNSFEMLTPQNYLKSAEDAVNMGKKLGDKVIVMSCSTGGTLSAILAAEGLDIHSLIMYSPNIDIYDAKSDLLLYPWGKELSYLVMGGEHNRVVYDSLGQSYWNSVYHTNALFALKSLINEFMTEETFAKINIPLFMGYYYKDEDHQDNVVSVPRMLDFFDQIGTPIDQKRKVAFPEAGTHVISSYVMSKDMDGVRKETYKWAEEVLGLKPIVK